MSKPIHDPYEEAKIQLRKAIDLLGYSDEIYEMLAVPERLIQVKVPVKMDDGTTKVFIGWRSQHNSALGPYKGGVRYHPNVHANEVIALSMWMTWKNSLAGLPYGGGKGGIRVDPRKLSKRELEQLSRNYFRAIAEVVGIDKDIPAPDVYTDPQTMAWFMDEYSRYAGYHAFGVVTGKPLLLGGLETRIISTGLGTALVARLAAEKLWGSVEGKTVAVQGYGNVGYHAAKFLHEWGAKIVAVSDSKGAIYKPEGLVPEDVKKVKSETGSVINYPGANRITNEQLLELDVDILVPAALENVITEKNVDRIKAKIISEGANGPTAPEADEVLAKKGVVVIPDIHANAGGVIMSHIEWVNNRMGGWITEEEARERLIKRMTDRFNAIWNFWEKIGRDRPMRDAAYALAVKRVVEAMKLRGWI